jgi:putative signal transducing protein
MGVKGWTVIFQGQRLRAELLQAILSADGIRAEVFGDTGYGVAIDLTDARLMVPDEQAGRARRLIREAEEATEEVTEEELEQEAEESPPEQL